MRINGKKFEIGDIIIVSDASGEFKTTLLRFNADNDGNIYAVAPGRNKKPIHIPLQGLKKE